MKDNSIHLDSPDLGSNEKDSLIACIESGYVSTFGPYVSEFEKRFARALGTDNAVATQSGTAGLHMALYELGIGTGDEVILPVLTFVATANAVRHVDARPVFVDVDPETWTIDPAKIESAVTSRTKAIIPVHLYGNPCEMDEIEYIASRHGLHIVEDATESLGASYKGKPTGTFGAFGVFSFNGNKLITTGGGGMVIGKEFPRIEHIRFLINQARDEGTGYHHSETGFNFRMTNLEAALGLAQLERMTGFLEKKKRIFEIYEEHFRKNEHINLQQTCVQGKSACWMTSVAIDATSAGMDVRTVQDRLKARGIPTRRVFPPLVTFPPYHDSEVRKYHTAYSIYENGLNLPSSTLNNNSQISYVASSVCDILSYQTRKSPIKLSL